MFCFDFDELSALYDSFVYCLYEDTIRLIPGRILGQAYSIAL